MPAAVKERGKSVGCLAELYDIEVRTISMKASVDVVTQLLVGLQVGVQLLEGRDADLDVLAC